MLLHSLFALEFLLLVAIKHTVNFLNLAKLSVIKSIFVLKGLFAIFPTTNKAHFLELISKNATHLSKPLRVGTVRALVALFLPIKDALFAE